ncbi:MAG: hypothetical protein Ct9H300mP26_5060 [Acidimicrobiales bacterium]|nr:MAG: hypothetical protein Ct9H300mP26_5060 [Acidimicrobiales bacterium]
MTRWASLLWPVAGNAELVRSLLSDLRVSKSISSQVAGIVDASQRLGAGCRCKSVVDPPGTARDPPEYGIGGALFEAYGQAPSDEVLVAMHRLEAEKGTKRFEVPLDGFEVAELIGKEGPDVGTTLSRLMDHRLDSGPLSKEEAIALVLDWKTKDSDDYAAVVQFVPQ